MFGLCEETGIIGAFCTLIVPYKGYTEGTVIDVVDVPTNEVPQQVLGEIELASKGSAKPLACYDLALLLEGAEIQPNGTIQITLPPLQQEFDADNVMVVYIAPDGSYQECKTTVNEDGTITLQYKDALSSISDTYEVTLKVVDDSFQFVSNKRVAE